MAASVTMSRDIKSRRRDNEGPEVFLFLLEVPCMNGFGGTSVPNPIGVFEVG